MSKPDKGQSFAAFGDRIGYDIGPDMVRNIALQHQKIFDFFPDFGMFIASYIVRKSFSRRTTAPTAIKDCICFFFLNVFEDPVAGPRGRPGTIRERPLVRVFPSGHSHMSHFKKGAHRKIVSIMISGDYLKSFLKADASRFRFLFETDQTYWIEEVMSDEMLRTVNAIVQKEEPDGLKAYHYRLKGLELLYYLFQSLNGRDQSIYQKLRDADIRAMYKVRDRLVASLDQFTPVATLQQIARMNEVKMRQLFKQIFGRGIYDYFQDFRMREAARLIREERLSVSEAGYRLGFSNLSHFSRVFEKYIGKKPKKYSSGL